ncbi:MAG: hypothetical protein ACKOYK_08785 [Cyanobium sp.]
MVIRKVGLAEAKAQLSALLDASAAGIKAFLGGEGFPELPIEAEHVLAVQHLPWIHRDPYRCAQDCVSDRLLWARPAGSG